MLPLSDTLNSTRVALLAATGIPVSHDQAATTIQKHIRGLLARKAHLPTYLYPHYRAQCNKVKRNASDSMPRAQGGHTRVYLPQEMPEVVLKHSGDKEAIIRFHQMQEVRAVLDSQHSSHLIIPKTLFLKTMILTGRL